MKKIFSVVFYFFFLVSISIAQEFCTPKDLVSTYSDKTLFLNWKDVNDYSSEQNLFLECFPICEVPASATISHNIDNGTGGWYRGMDGNFYCWEGPDCDLTPNVPGFAAVAIWSAQGSSIDSRMNFGPFDLPAEGNLSLGFLEAYIDGAWQEDPNTVEISTDDGQSWEQLYESSAANIGENWTATPIDLGRFSGQTIHISFRYQCSVGYTEAWLVDHVAVNVVTGLDSASFAMSPVIDTGSIDNDYYARINSVDRDGIMAKAEIKRLDRSNYKPNYFISSTKKEKKKELVYTPSNIRDCADPDTQTEVLISLSEGNWAEEITWALVDSSGGSVLFGDTSGVAPFDTTMCLTNGYYKILGYDSYGDGWNEAVFTITDVNTGITYLNFTIGTGYEANQMFYLGPYYGCTDPVATNYDPLANTDDGTCEYQQCNQNVLTVQSTLGSWPEEVSWHIWDSLGTLVSEGVAGDIEQICVPNGSYKVNGYDTYGDGWNGSSLLVTDTSNNYLLAWTFNTGYQDSTSFYVGPVYGCTDPQADNYDPDATVDDSSCVYIECFDAVGYRIYLDGDGIDFTTDNYYIYSDLENGKEYELGVAAVYDAGFSDRATITSVPWNEVVFDPISIQLDTLVSGNNLEGDFTFIVDNDVWFTTPFNISSPNMIDVDYSSSMLYSDFNSENFTTMYDPSGIFGGLWRLGDSRSATSAYFPYEDSPDTSNFTYINDDAIGAAGGSEAAYLISNNISINEGERVFITLDVYFPQPYGSCFDPAPNSGINGEGFSEDLYLMISGDDGSTWTVVDSTMGSQTLDWVSQMYDITDELDGMTTFMVALFYSDCNGNWAFGVGVDNFAIHIADDDEFITVNPYNGWAEAGSDNNVTISVPNDPSIYGDIYVQLSAGFGDTLNVPISFGLEVLATDSNSEIIPSRFALYQNYPNPFNPFTIIPFEIPNTESIQLTIYNILGEKVNTLVNKKLDPGMYNIRWNGLSDAGRLMPAGLYFYELKGRDFRDTGKMLFLK